MEENKNETPMKKSNKGLVAILAIIIIAILAGVGYYFLKPTSPKDIFVGGINSAFENSEKQLSTDVTKMNTTVTLSGNIESSNEEISKVAKYINEGKLTYNVQFDKETKKALLSANVDYQNENLLSGKIYYANGDDNIYLYVQDLFDKYFKFNLKELVDDEEDIATIENMFNGEASTPFGKTDSKKAMDILKNTIESNLKDEYFTQEKVDGMKKNTMKLTVGELRQLVKNIVSSLKDNQDFIACFEKADEVKEGFEELLEEIDEVDNDADNYNLDLSIYTKGIKNEFEKFEFKASISETEQFVMTITEPEENKYEINADVPEVGKVKLNVEVKNDTNTDLENVNVSDSVDINNLTQADQLKILGNVLNMKIYKYIEPAIQGRNESGLLFQN